MRLWRRGEPFVMGTKNAGDGWVEVGEEGANGKCNCTEAC